MNISLTYFFSYIYMKWVQVTPDVTLQKLHLFWTINYYQI